jgi:hypothetical protein
MRTHATPKDLRNFDLEMFNSLPDIETADQTLRESGKLEKALDCLGPLFIAHDLHNDWGISLLHRHWPIYLGELPLQRREVQDGQETFVTSPWTSDIATSWPTTIAVRRSGRLRPVEFSTLEGSEAAYKKLIEAKQFLVAAIHLWGREDLFDTFALSMLRYDPSGRTKYLETTLPDRVSLVRRISSEKEIDQQRVIETTWRFSPDAPTLGCEKLCVQLCPVDGNGNHSGATHKGPMHRPT